MYLFPFHAHEVAEILRRCRKTICVEANYSGQFARYLRAETGISVDAHIRKYDGEPFEPRYIVERVKAILDGRPLSLEVTEEEAREIAYHYIRTHLDEDARPGRISRLERDGFEEPIWNVEIVSRETGRKRGRVLIGIETGSTYRWEPEESAS